MPVLRLLLLFLWLTAADFSSIAASSSITRAVKYVDLRDWAEENDFNYVPRGKNDLIWLTNRWARMSFALDSRRAEINGTAVWLSFDLIPAKGSIQIAEKDVETVLKPILYPAKNKQRPVKVIAISAGHGGRDPGNLWGTHQEKKYNLLLALELEKALVAAGFKVVQIRRQDQFIPLEEHPRLAAAKGADTFVCLHYNSTETETNSVKGVEVYCLTPPGAISTNGGEWVEKPLPGNTWDKNNVLLAYHVQRSIVNNFGMVDRGVRHARFVVLKGIHMPAILVEGGFMSNPDDARKIFDPKHRKEMARAIVDGILAYKRIIER